MKEAPRKHHKRQITYLLWERDGSECVNCGVMTVSEFDSWPQVGLPFTKDHIIPRAKGGVNALSNLQVLCFPCNQAKGSSSEQHIWSY